MIQDRLKTTNLWHFVWISVVSSEIFTSIMSILLRGRITLDYLITGGIVSLLVSSVVIYLIKLMRKMESRSEKAVREIHERYRQLVELSPDAVTLSDLEGKILTVNAQKVRQSGYDKKELIGMNSFDLIVPSDRDRARKILEETLGKGIIRNVHYTLLRKDGTTYKGELNASVVEDAEGKPTGFIGVVRDITERDKRLHELEKWEKVTVDRELKMIELKKKIKELEDTLDEIEGDK